MNLRTGVSQLTAKDAATFLPVGIGMVAVVAMLLEGPLAALLIALLPLLALTIWRYPAVLLAVGALTNLFGGNYSTIAVAGLAATAFGFAVLLPKTATLEKESLLLALTISALPIYLTLRFAIAGEIGASITASWLALTVYIAAVSIQQQGYRVVLYLLGAAGLVFILVTIGANTIEGTLGRATGVSGNPNRMVAGALVLGPLSLALFRKYTTIWLVHIAVVLAIISWICIESASSQAVAGAISTGIGIGIWFIAKTGTRYRIGFLLLSMAAATIVLLTVTSEIELTNDLSTLSGRTPLFQSAIDEFQRAPLTGTGSVHVSAGLLLDRSAHSAFLGLLASGGILAGLGWLVLTGRTVADGIRCAGERVHVTISALSILILMFVQSFEYSTTVWATMAAIILGEASIRQRGK